MRLLGNTENVIAKNRNGENVPKLEIVDVISMHCNVVNNSYQQVSKVLFKFVADKELGQLITFAPHLLTMLKATNAEFGSIEVWFTDQNSRPLEFDSNNWNRLIQIRYSTEPRKRKYVK